MPGSLMILGSSLLARWRWWRGRCPICNRNLYASIPYFQADYPNCFCRGETQADSQFWNKYQDALLEKAGAVRLEIQNEGAVLAARNRKEDRAELLRWESEGGSNAPPGNNSRLIP
jgi:hypothetical protein